MTKHELYVTFENHNKLNSIMKEKIAEILYIKDIMKLNSPIAFEYYPEAESICIELGKAKYSNRIALSRMIHKVFVKYFGESYDSKGNRFSNIELVPYGEIYQEVADEILKIED